MSCRIITKGHNNKDSSLVSFLSFPFLLFLLFTVFFLLFLGFMYTGGKVSCLARILRGYLGNTRMSLTLAARVATIFEVVVLTHRTSPRLLPETRLDVLVVRLTTRPPFGVTGILGSGTGKVIP